MRSSEVACKKGRSWTRRKVLKKSRTRLRTTHHIVDALLR